MNISDKVNIIISARDQFTGVLRRLGSALRRMSVAAQQVGTAFTTMAAGMAAALTKVLKLTIEYDDQLRELAAKAEIAFDSEGMANMREEIRRLGRETSYTASEVGKMFTILAAKGWDANEIIGAGERFLYFAGAMKAPLDEAADTLAAAMAVFGEGSDKSAEKIDHFSSVLYSATVGSSLKFEDLTASLKKVALGANEVNHGLEGTVANLMVMANVERRNSIAGRQLQSAYNYLFSAEGRKGLKEWNIDLHTTQGAVKSFAELLIEMDEELDKRKIFEPGDRTAAANEVFGGIGENAMKAIRQSVHEVDKLEEKLFGLHDTARRAYLVMEGGPGGAMRRLNSAFQDLILSIGDDMKTWLSAASHGIVKLLGTLKDWIKGDGTVGIKLIAATVALLATGLTLLGTAIAGITLASFVSSMAALIGMLVSAAPIVLALGLAFEELYEAASGTNIDSSIGTKLLKTVKILWNDVGDALKEIMMLLARGEWEQALEYMSAAFSKFAASVLKDIKPVYVAMKETFTFKALGGLGTIWGDLKNATGVMPIGGGAWLAKQTMDSYLLQGRFKKFDPNVWKEKHGKDSAEKWKRDYTNEWNQVMREYDDWIGMDKAVDRANDKDSDPILDMIENTIAGGKQADSKMEALKQANKEYEDAVAEIFKLKAIDPAAAKAKEEEVRKKYKDAKQFRDLENFDRILKRRKEEASAAKKKARQDQFSANKKFMEDYGNEWLQDHGYKRVFDPTQILKTGTTWGWVLDAREVKRTIESIKFDKLGDWTGAGAAAKMNEKLNETQSKQLKELEKANFLLEQIRDKDIPAGGIVIQ